MEYKDSPNLFTLNPEELDLPEKGTTPWPECDIPECHDPYEFCDEDSFGYCHAHMVDPYGPCSDNCTSDDNCPNHILWVSHLIEEGRWSG